MVTLTLGSPVVYAPTKVRNFKQITTQLDIDNYNVELFMHLQR